MVKEGCILRADPLFEVPFNRPNFKAFKKKAASAPSFTEGASYNSISSD
jgi:hypothetical protein